MLLPIMIRLLYSPTLDLYNTNSSFYGLECNCYLRSYWFKNWTGLSPWFINWFKYITFLEYWHFPENIFLILLLKNINKNSQFHSFDFYNKIFENYNKIWCNYSYYFIIFRVLKQNVYVYIKMFLKKKECIN